MITTLKRLISFCEYLKDKVDLDEEIIFTNKNEELIWFRQSSVTGETVEQETAKPAQKPEKVKKPKVKESSEPKEEPVAEPVQEEKPIEEPIVEPAKTFRYLCNWCQKKFNDLDEYGQCPGCGEGKDITDNHAGAPVQDNNKLPYDDSFKTDIMNVYEEWKKEKEENTILIIMKEDDDLYITFEDDAVYVASFTNELIASFPGIPKFIRFDNDIMKIFEVKAKSVNRQFDIILYSEYRAKLQCVHTETSDDSKVDILTNTRPIESPVEEKPEEKTDPWEF